MPRKIYDIKPRKAISTIENDSGELLIAAKTRRTRSRRRKGKNFMWPSILIIVLLIILGGGTYLFFKLPKAEITLWPKLETLSFKQAVVAEKSAELIDSIKAIIPAKYFEAIKTNAQDFPATGNASNEGKAHGTITVYNKYDPLTPFTFKAGTRFMSDSGKIFIALSKVVIPAAKKSGGKITPGSVQIEVEAVEGGSSYNIAPANFSVPGLKGTAYYYSVYATSENAMAGGYSGKVKKVTEDDIETAKEVLTEKTTADAIAELKKQISSDYVLLDGAVASGVTNASTKTKSGTIAETFNYQATVSASGVVFKRVDLEKYAKDYIISQIQEGQALLESSFKMNYVAKTIDVSAGKEIIDLDFSSDAYQKVDKNSLALSLFGKNADQIKQTITSVLGETISKFKIKLWPFWVKYAPKNQNAVNIELNFQ